MRQRIREQLVRCMPSRFREWCVRATPEFADVLNGVAKISYSQQGEDLAIERYFKGRKNGFFVDVGAYHPVKYSNTYKLYCQGWSGINIDANPDAIAMFQDQRRRDVNINAGISEFGEVLTYTRFSEPTLNTFDPDHASLWAARDGFDIIEQVNVPTRRLSTVLDEFIDSDRPIDLMNIDVEGLDLQVLRSNDWTRYLPELLLVERSLRMDQCPAEDEIVKMLNPRRYSLRECIGGTLLFCRDCSH